MEYRQLLRSEQYNYQYQGKAGTHSMEGASQDKLTHSNECIISGYQCKHSIAEASTKLNLKEVVDAYKKWKIKMNGGYIISLSQ